MFKKISGFLVLALLIGLVVAQQPAKGAQEIKELALISKFLSESFGSLKRVHRLSHEMKEHARPFMVKRHRDRYRFEPGDKVAREIMSLSRKAASNFKMVNGILHQSDIVNRQALFKDFSDTMDNVATFCKRAIRANKDNNYALYLASAQGIEKEIVIGNDLLNDLELAINYSVAQSDAKKENL
jgi:hypothetical protein